MSKVLFGVIILVVCVLFVVSFIVNASDEPNVVKALQEKGYTDIKVINKKPMKFTLKENESENEQMSIFENIS